MVTIRHTAPLADMNTDEFRDPLPLVTMAADNLEGLLLGVDKF